MPDPSEIFNVLLLRDYNTRLVILCSLLLGCACGLMGGFLLLRKRSLLVFINKFLSMNGDSFLYSLILPCPNSTCVEFR